ncbi:hypothetical protein HELRODRAFT_165433 [Helobdella robusta]|uniref:Uncharacterized protein n=1 Tax=Helobdella robusta TaxID=6412 RepID=T1EWS3_HELRO|nr:hypothetical protein HELRODRAFT_165433 [Helobdella robusta]ESN91403.1 hypothetical protein HELRODRAFT_165433 [Helobdella robusta]
MSIFQLHRFLQIILKKYKNNITFNQARALKQETKSSYAHAEKTCPLNFESNNDDLYHDLISLKEIKYFTDSDLNMEITQGSILSVTLFCIKIYGLVNIIPSEVLKYLCVDDVMIALKNHCTENIEKKIKINAILNDIFDWSYKNGIIFSSSKTKAIVFSKKRDIVYFKLTYGNKQIQFENQIKYYNFSYLYIFPSIFKVLYNKKNLSHIGISDNEKVDSSGFQVTSEYQTMAHHSNGAGSRSSVKTSIQQQSLILACLFLLRLIVLLVLIFI